jgi:hypothetical protein
MIAYASVVVWLERYPHLGTQTANDVLLTGFIIFVAVYITIAVMMKLYYISSLVVELQFTW